MIGTPPSTAEFERLARAAMATIPARLRTHLDGVVVHVAEFPDPEVQDEMGLESPYDLLGLYQGVPLVERSVGDVPQGPDQIFLYRQPLLQYWYNSGEDLARLVRHVLIHEVGHHFGFSDDDMARLEAEAED